MMNDCWTIVKQFLNDCNTIYEGLLKGFLPNVGRLLND